MSNVTDIQFPGADPIEQPEAPAIKRGRRPRADVEAQPEAAEPIKQADVDPNKITRAVLTADGYVCPAPRPDARVTGR